MVSGIRPCSSRALPLPVVMGISAGSEARLLGGAGVWFRPSYIRFPLGESLLPFPAALPGKMAAQHPLRVLALAGFRQSERGFREKTGALRKALRGRAELVCLSGPHLVADAAGPEDAGPDSGETGPVWEMHSESFIWPRFRNTLQRTLTLNPRLVPSPCPYSSLLPSQPPRLPP